MHLDAELVCTELVTNAIQHSGGPTEVRLAAHDNQSPMLGVALAGLPLAGVRIEVDDATPILPTLRWSRRPGTAG